MSSDFATLTSFFADGRSEGGLPADIPPVESFPTELDDGTRLVGVRSDRQLVYHRPPAMFRYFEIPTAPPTDADDLVQTDKAGGATGPIGRRAFEDARTAISDADWFATTDYASVFLETVDTERYPESLAAEATDDSKRKSLLGVDTRGLAHYEVEADVPYIQRYAPLEDGIARYEQRYAGEYTPDHGLDHRHMAQYVIEIEVEHHGWEKLGKAGQIYARDFLNLVASVESLVG